MTNDNIVSTVAKTTGALTLLMLLGSRLHALVHLLIQTWQAVTETKFTNSLHDSESLHGAKITVPAV